MSTKGDDVANLLRNRIKIGVSSRGVGSLKEARNGEQIVQDDFEIFVGMSLQPHQHQMLGYLKHMKIQNHMLRTLKKKT
jgi:hypothetical protein